MCIRDSQKVVHVRGVDVIEDCYNANPDSMKAALAMFREYPCKRRFARLGDMLELGDISRAAHEEVGRQAVENKVDYPVSYTHLDVYKRQVPAMPPRRGTMAGPRIFTGPSTLS